MKWLIDKVEKELAETHVAGVCHEQAETVVKMVLDGICPKNAILFKVVPCHEPGDVQGYAVEVLGGAVQILSASLGDIEINTSISELASDFDQCLTPGRALIAYGEGLDVVLAREAYEARVLVMKARDGEPSE